ncbi:MAG: SRPBCC family protein, partial [Cyanobacteria bacterium REEB65]|nr:SRPBCC family protein [Cyanobacteria bacterium REEB65]
MGHITIVETINASVEDVFAYVDDYKNTTKYMRDLTKWKPVGAKNHGKGAIFDVAMKAGPKSLDSTIEMYDWAENKLIAWESTDGFYQKGKWAFKAKGSKTEATFDMEFEF